MILTDELMVLCAFRYCLGRMTYAVSTCVDWLLRNWGGFSKHTQERIVKEINEAFDKNNYGMEMDKEQWQRILDKHEEEKKC